MLNKNPVFRVSAEEALEHEWFKKFDIATQIGQNPSDITFQREVLNRLKNFDGVTYLRFQFLKQMIKTLDDSLIMPYIDFYR